MSFQQLSTDLIQAIKTKDISRIRQMLTKNRDLVNYQCLRKNSISSAWPRQWQTPLWHAMIDGHEDIVEVLILEFKANTERKNISGYTFLQYLGSLKECSAGHIKVAEVLIRHGADVHAEYKQIFGYNGTPLQIALHSCNLRYADFLLNNGASVCVGTKQDAPVMRTNQGTLASYAFCCKDVSTREEMLLLLLKHGLNTTFHNDQGYNLLHIFISSLDKVRSKDKIEQDNAAKTAEILLNMYGIPVNEFTGDKDLALHMAIEKRDVKLVEVLINAGADINIESKNYSPLGLAVYTGLKELVALIVSSGAAIDALPSLGYTALHQACFSEFGDIINYLLRKGADVNIEAKDGITAFTALFNYYGYRKIRLQNFSCVTTILKKLGKLSMEDVPLLETDMEVINAEPVYKKLLEDCKSELTQMSRTKFYPPYSYYSVLNMSKNIKKLSNLTKNDEFVVNFKKNLSFPLYRNDLEYIFNEAVQLRDDSLTILSRLNSIFGDILPSIVNKKLAANLSVKDLPLE